MLDYRVSDLKKRLNNLKFKTAEQRSYLDKLLVEQQKISKESSEKVCIIPEFQPFSSLISQTGNVLLPENIQRQRYLENEIHKTSLKMMEADMVRNKYSLIHDMLRREKMYYCKQQSQLDELLKQKNKELGKLNEVNL